MNPSRIEQAVRNGGGRRLARVTAVALVVTALAGCGGGEDAPSEGKPSRTAAGGAAERQAPPGASPTLKAIYRQFPKPRTPAGVAGAAAALRAGEEACRGLTPEEVKRRYLGKAGAHLLPDQRKMVAKLESYARDASSDASFVAGQLAALVYEKSLGGSKLARFGYQGCIYQLARGTERQLEAQSK